MVFKCHHKESTLNEIIFPNYFFFFWSWMICQKWHFLFFFFFVWLFLQDDFLETIWIGIFLPGICTHVASRLLWDSFPSVCPYLYAHRLCHLECCVGASDNTGRWRLVFLSLSLSFVSFSLRGYIYKVFICLCMCPLSAPRSQCRAGCGFLPIRDRDEWEPRKRKSQEKIRGPQVWNQQGSLLLSLFPNQLGKMPQ